MVLKVAKHEEAGAVREVSARCVRAHGALMQAIAGTQALGASGAERLVLQLMVRLATLYAAESLGLLRSRWRYTQRLRERALWSALLGDVQALGVADAPLPLAMDLGDGAATTGPDADFTCLAAVEPAWDALQRGLDLLRAVPWAQGGLSALGALCERLSVGAANRGRVGGWRRKQQGVYYSPEPLVRLLVGRNLAPLLERATGAPDALAALGRLRICDPACGSGRLLMAAAREVAAAWVAYNGMPPGEALALVLGASVFGLDVDPLAVELCRAVLCLEGAGAALTRDLVGRVAKHVRCGDALLGLGPRAEGAWCGTWADATAQCARGLRDAGAMASRGWRRAFHWPLAFGRRPDEAGLRFALVLCNPPWERLKAQAREWFGEVSGREAAGGQLEAARSEALFRSRWVRNSGRFPLSARGDVNTYALFAELCRDLMAPHGRAGLIVPSGIATDFSTRDLFADFMRRRQVDTLWDFENRLGWFADVDRRFRFSLLSLSACPTSKPPRFAFFLQHPDELREEGRDVAVTSAMLARCNPNTHTVAPWRSAADAARGLAMHEKVPVLWDEGDPEGNRWGLSLVRLFDMTNDRAHFATAAELAAVGCVLIGNHQVGDGERWLPLYEAKMVTAFDHRHGSHCGADAAAGGLGWRVASPSVKADPCFVSLPRFWVRQRLVDARLGQWDAEWLLGFRSISSPTNARTLIASLLPRSGVGNSLPLLLVDREHRHLAPLLMANLNALVVDYLVRQKLGGTNLNHFVLKQVPILSPERYSAPCPWEVGSSVAAWLLPRVLALVCTNVEMAHVAVALGAPPRPQRWDEGRRLQLRCEIDAAYFRLYGASRSDVAAVLASFPVLARREMARWGAYRSAEGVLAAWERLAAAEARGGQR